MPTDPVALADKIAAKAEELCEPLEIEMNLRKWPADFRKIMWEAVATHAHLLAAKET